MLTHSSSRIRCQSHYRSLSKYEPWYHPSLVYFAASSLSIHVLYATITMISNRFWHRILTWQQAHVDAQYVSNLFHWVANPCVLSFITEFTSIWRQLLFTVLLQFFHAYQPTECVPWKISHTTAVRIKRWPRHNITTIASSFHTALDKLISSAQG